MSSKTDFHGYNFSSAQLYMRAKEEFHSIMNDCKKQTFNMLRLLDCEQLYGKIIVSD